MKPSNPNARTLVVASIIATLSINAATADPVDWQLDQLHDPSTGQLRAEHAGRVTIYDGLTATEVERAMDEQFERIDSMMFVRTQYPVESGEYTEDADCD